MNENYLNYRNNKQMENKIKNNDWILFRPLRKNLAKDRSFHTLKINGVKIADVFIFKNGMKSLFRIVERYTRDEILESLNKAIEDYNYEKRNV